jgi:hypothetical protein
MSQEEDRRQEKMTNYEELQRRKEELLDSRKREESHLTRINEELSSLNRQIRKSTGLISRIKGKNVQSRIYVTEVSDLGKLQKGMTHSDLLFPLETTSDGRVLILKYFPFGTSEEFYKFLGRVEGIDCIKKQKCKRPKIIFESIFSMKDMWNYDVFYLDGLAGTPSTLRTGKAIVYLPYSYQKEVVESVRVPGEYEFPGGCYQDSDGPWIPEHWENKRTGRYETVKTVKESEPFPMAILSARSSEDLDSLEKKLGLVK